MKSQRTNWIITPVLPTRSSSPALGSVRTRRTWQNVPSLTPLAQLNQSQPRPAALPQTGILSTLSLTRALKQDANSRQQCQWWPVSSWAPHFFSCCCILGVCLLFFITDAAEKRWQSWEALAKFFPSVDRSLVFGT